MESKRPSSRQGAMKAGKPPSRLRMQLTPDRIFIGGSILLAVVIIGIIAISTSQNRDMRNVQIDGIQFFPVISNQHVDGNVDYPQTPPVGGPHNPVWQTCGVYTEPIMDEHAVHDLEHGAVWITYQPDLPADQVAKLAQITRGGTHRLLSPYVGLDSPIVASAWGYQLRVQDANDSRLTDFIAKYEQGPQTPEMGATCSGGETRTLRQLTGG